MTTFDERKTAFEAEFARDEDLRFKVEARRNKLVGAWAAEILGLSGEEAIAYGKEVVRADFEEAGDEDVFRKLRGDLNEAREEVTDAEIRQKMAECLSEAMTQIKAGK
ncbi:MAG: DUF1476 domain-containing protein [Pseudomonadota bacterium]